MNTSLYRCYAADGTLLYVGISFRPTRFSQHRRDKDWWSDVSAIDIEHYPDRDSAKAAEDRAILVEQPVHNIVGAARQERLFTESRYRRIKTTLGNAKQNQKQAQLLAARWQSLIEDVSGQLADLDTRPPWSSITQTRDWHYQAFESVARDLGMRVSIAEWQAKALWVAEHLHRGRMYWSDEKTEDSLTKMEQDVHGTSS